jgi:hypothetical protein
MSTILNISQVLRTTERLEDIKDVNIAFDFQLEGDNLLGDIFRVCNDVFALTIKRDRVVIANDTILIDEPIELQENEEYRVEYGIKMDYLFSCVVLYIRIWQEIKIPQAFYDAFEEQSA